MTPISHPHHSCNCHYATYGIHPHQAQRRAMAPTPAPAYTSHICLQTVPQPAVPPMYNFHYGYSQPPTSREHELPLGGMTHPSYCSNYMPRSDGSYLDDSTTHQRTTSVQPISSGSNPPDYFAREERKHEKSLDAKWDAAKRRAHRIKVLQRSRMRHADEANYRVPYQYALTCNPKVDQRRRCSFGPSEGTQRDQSRNDDNTERNSNGGEENGNSGSNSDMGGSGMETNATGQRGNPARNGASSPADTWNETDDPSSSFGGSQVVSPGGPNPSGSSINNTKRSK